MKVLVCGGREFADRDAVFDALDELHEGQDGPITLLIHGAARGADSLGGEWAASRKVPVRPYPADWEKHGRAAGPKRNQQMLDEGKPDLVVAFPGGNGTAHMVKIATDAGVRVWRP